MQKAKKKQEEPVVLPLGAVVDEELLGEVRRLCGGLPGSIVALYELLREREFYVEFDAACEEAIRHVLGGLEGLFQGTKEERLTLLRMAKEYMRPEACVRICRRLVKDGDQQVRGRARTLIRHKGIKEVALPLEEGGDWSPEGWLRGVHAVSLFERRQGERVQRERGVPVLLDVGQMRALLGIRSEKQLGFLFVSQEGPDGRGPYVRFSIPKRDGTAREICAPKTTLRRVQRAILDKILGLVPAHDAAHGFVVGRSTVTNAQAHIGRKLILKFDLVNFFPTIHFFRVLGLFGHLGYDVGDGLFHKQDASRSVGPALARLTTYVPSSEEWGNAHLPQGAPTSPALANLVCRGLDARLAGLAQRMGGVYTRYADDLTFSFDVLSSKDVGRFRWWVDQICQQEGFAVNQKKFRVVRASQRQVVTGLVVNDVMRVPREERRRFRAILHNCRRDGLASQARGNPKFAQMLRGYASYVHMVHPEEGKRWMEEVDALLKAEGVQESDDGGEA